jgi:hypothetical protein
MAASQRPEGPVSFSTLSSTARVINISPAWPSVAQALTYLRATPPPLPGPEYDVAVQTVHEFAELLRRNADTIANALLCGTMLGGLMPGRSPAAALRAGLMIISEAFRFSMRDELEIRAILAGQMKWLPRILNIEPVQMEDLRMAETGGEWALTVGNAIQAVRNQRAPVSVDELRPFVEHGLKSRVEAFLQGNAAELPRPEELIGHAAGEVNSEFLRWDLGRMTALQWSRVVAAWVHPETPERRPAPWLVIGALTALGFVINNPAGVALWLDFEGPGWVQEALPTFRRSGASAERSVLLVRDTTRRTIAERWLPTPEVAALVLPPEPAARLINQLSLAETRPPVTPELRVIAIEGVLGAAKLREILFTFHRGDPFERLRERFQFAHVLPSEVEADPFDRLGPVIVRPRGFKDLVERMEARVPHRVEQAPKM